MYREGLPGNVGLLLVESMPGTRKRQGGGEAWAADRHWSNNCPLAEAMWPPGKKDIRVHVYTLPPACPVAGLSIQPELLRALSTGQIIVEMPVQSS